MTTARKAAGRVREFRFVRGYDVTVSGRTTDDGVIVTVEDLLIDNEIVGLLMQMAAGDGFTLHVRGR